MSRFRKSKMLVKGSVSGGVAGLATAAIDIYAPDLDPNAKGVAVLGIVALVEMIRNRIKHRHRRSRRNHEV